MAVALLPPITIEGAGRRGWSKRRPQMNTDEITIKETVRLVDGFDRADGINKDTSLRHQRRRVRPMFRVRVSPGLFS